MRSKSYLLATVSSLALFGVVSVAAAADLPARGPVMPAKAPVVAVPFNWTGFYLGVHGGGAWLDHKQTTFENNGACDNFQPTNFTSICSFRASGGTFGGLAGYNIQSGRVVFGLEVDGSWTGLKASRLSDSNALVNPLTLRTEVSWLATVRGRIGLTMSPTLIYVTGGAAFGGVKSSWFDSGTTPFGLAVDKIKAGWVAGGGIEHAFAANWTARVEALYHDLGTVSAGPISLAGATYNTTFRHRVTTARAAVALRW